MYDNDNILNIDFYKEISSKLHNNNIKINLYITHNYKKLKRIFKYNEESYRSGYTLLSTKQYENLSDTQINELSNIIRTSINHNKYKVKDTLIISKINFIKSYKYSILNNIIYKKYKYDTSSIKNIFLYDALNPFYKDIKYL